MKTIRITPRSDREQALWRLAKEVAGTFDGLPWTVIGGVMVRIVEAEHGIMQSPYLTRDLDTILDLRADGASTQEAARRLMAAGFEPVPKDRGITYRFQRGGDMVDVLAPDNLGDRSTPTTVPPNVTIHADGGRGALNHTRQVVIDAGEGVFTVPLPDLVGAIVVKAQALETATDADERVKHRRDLARLLILADDPFALAETLTKGERRHLRVHRDLTRADHLVWVDFENGDRGRAALLALLA